jgi:lysyl-tRNA synthetase, class II
MSDSAIPESELLALRRAKTDFLRQRGINPFGQAFDVSHGIGHLKANFSEAAQVSVAGRITSWRDMGKSQFFDLSSIEGRVQCYLNKKEIGDEAFETFSKGLDIGDWLGVEGETFVTKTGEPSIKVTLSPSSRKPAPAARQVARGDRSPRRSRGSGIST